MIKEKGKVISWIIFTMEAYFTEGAFHESSGL
jgi:hypothetical protein